MVGACVHRPQIQEAHERHRFPEKAGDLRGIRVLVLQLFSVAAAQCRFRASRRLC